MGSEGVKEIKGNQRKVLAGGGRRRRRRRGALAGAWVPGFLETTTSSRSVGSGPSVLHLSSSVTLVQVPTTRPRHVITETDEIARAIDDAAKRWPEDRNSRARLLLHL